MSPSTPTTPTAGAPPDARPQRDLRSIGRRLLRSREISVLIVLALIFVYMWFTEERFFNPANRSNVLRQTSMLAIFAIGETLVIITAGIDLSLGSMIAFIGMVMALMVTKFAGGMGMTMAVILGVTLSLLVALAIGATHATLIHKLRLPAFVVTLGSLLILRSQALLINNQAPVPISEFKFLTDLANADVAVLPGLTVPTPFLILLVVAALTSIALNRMRIGRYLYSVGSNEQATELSGVSVYKVKLFAYGMSAMLGGLAGVLWAGYSFQGNPQSATGYELDAVAAAVVGGANLMGGEGSVTGTLLGALLLMVIFSAINLRLSNPDVWRGTVVGGILLLAVLVTALQQRRAA